MVIRRGKSTASMLRCVREGKIHRCHCHNWCHQTFFKIHSYPVALINGIIHGIESTSLWWYFLVKKLEFFHVFSLCHQSMVLGHLRVPSHGGLVRIWKSHRADEVGYPIQQRIFDMLGIAGIYIYNQHWKFGWWIYPRYGWEITSQQLHNQNLYKSYIADMIDGIAIQPDISRLDFTWIVVPSGNLLQFAIENTPFRNRWFSYSKWWIFP